MKKIGLILFASLLVLGYANPTFADAETDRQQSYIAKIQAQNISYSASGLFDAISQDKPELVEMFMQAGMSPNTTFLKLPALYYAISMGSTKSMQVLINHGAEVNSVNSKFTPLMFAITRKQISAAELLLVNGADVNKGVGDLTPINYAIKKKEYSLATKLVNAGAKVDDDTVISAIKSKDQNLKSAVFRRYQN